MRRKKSEQLYLQLQNVSFPKTPSSSSIPSTTSKDSVTSFTVKPVQLQLLILLFIVRLGRILAGSGISRGKTLTGFTRMNSLRIWFWDLKCLIIRINGIPRCLGSSRKMPIRKNWMNYLNRSWMSLILLPIDLHPLQPSPPNQSTPIPSKSSIKRPNQLSIPSCVTSKINCPLSSFRVQVRLWHYRGLLLLQHFHGLEDNFCIWIGCIRLLKSRKLDHCLSIF